MTFESRIIAFADRFLSDRTVELVVAPALADLQFESGTKPLSRAANRSAVLRAVAGGLFDEVTRGCGDFVGLMLVPAFYYLFLLVICFDFFPTTYGFLYVMATVVLVLSLGPVLVCFWPARYPRRSID